MSGIFSASRLSPQEQRLEQLKLMKQKITARPFEEVNIEILLEEFEDKTGASEVRAKEYFKVESNILLRKGQLQFSEDGKRFTYQAGDEETALRANMKIFEGMKQRLEEIEKAKNAQTVKPS